MKVTDGETADTFVVSGRGTLHITILIENMRREGYEFMIGPPQVINREVKGKKHEPYEVNRNFISVNTLCLSIMYLVR
jgi:GTP-binding protein